MVTQTPINRKKLLTVKELAGYLSVSEPTAAQWGRFIGAMVRIGGRVFYDREKVDNCIEFREWEE